MEKMTPQETEYVGMKRYVQEITEELLTYKAEIIKTFVALSFPAFHFTITIFNGDVNISLPANEQFMIAAARVEIAKYLSALDDIVHGEPSTEDFK
jgi:hypothetical protein